MLCSLYSPLCWTPPLPIPSPCFVLRHRLELGFRVGQTSRSADGQNEERRSLWDKVLTLGKSASGLSYRWSVDNFQPFLATTLQDVWDAYICGCPLWQQEYILVSHLLALRPGISGNVFSLLHIYTEFKWDLKSGRTSVQTFTLSTSLLGSMYVLTVIEKVTNNGWALSTSHRQRDLSNRRKDNRIYLSTHI